MRAVTFVILSLFTLSGIAGLLYQLVWIRALTHLLGGTSFAISAVLAAFMGGLAFGSRFFGRRTDLARDPLRLYAFLEIGIAALGALVLVLLPILKPVYVGLVHAVPSGVLLWRILVAFVVVFPPTFLMGGTLPVLSRFIVTKLDQVGRRLGLLYALNTLGAVLGAYLAGFVLIGTLGLTRCTILAVAVNLAIGLGVLLVRRRLPAPETVPDPETAPPSATVPEPTPEAPPAHPFERHERPIESRPSGFPQGLLVAIFALSGFAALSLEIYWTRALQHFLDNSIYAYSAMLTTFLLGLSVGGWVGGRLADRVESPGRLLSWVQLGIGMSVVATVPVIWEALPWLREQAFLSLDHGNWNTYVRRRFVVAFAVMAVPTFLFGMTFPIINRMGIRDLSRVGSSVGGLYFANTIGSILGALAAGFLILPAIGVKAAILATAVWSAILGVAAQVGTRPRRPAGVVVAVVVAAAILGATPILKRAGSAIFADTQRPDDRVLFEREDSVAETRVYARPDGELHMSVDGHHIGGTNREVLRKEKILAHLPMALVPKVDKALSIGLGSGITFGTLAFYDEIRELTCVEIVPGVVDGARLFSEHHGDVFSDDRATVHVEDGVQFLLTTRERYDVISSDSKLNPAYSGNAPLLSRDYYRLCNERLTDHGVMVQWIVLHMPQSELVTIVRSFTDAFPHTALFWHSPINVILVGSRSPVTVDMNRVRRLARDDRYKSDFRLLQIENPYAFASLWITGGDGLRDAVGDGPVNTWDVPRLELAIVPALLLASPVDSEQANLHWLESSADPAGVPLRGEYDVETMDLFRRSALYLLRGYGAGGGVRDLRPGRAIFLEGSRLNPDDRRLRMVLRHLSEG